MSELNNIDSQKVMVVRVSPQSEKVSRVRGWVLKSSLDRAQGHGVGSTLDKI